MLLFIFFNLNRRIIVNNVTVIRGGIKIKRVLLSVSDKTNLDFLIAELLKVNPEVMFYSTSGTYARIKEILDEDLAKMNLADRIRTRINEISGGDLVKINLTDISDYTGFPEMQGGLVKTLHPKIHMGILAERMNATHSTEMLKIGAVLFDLVVVNLYPFSSTVAKEDCTFEMARSNIDIGGPTMIRAAAKNYHGCAVLSNPDDYNSFMDELALSKGFISLETRFELMKKAFIHSSFYELTISEYLANINYEDMKKRYYIQNS